MKCILLLLLGFVALVAARPDNVLNFDFDDFGHNQSIDDDSTVTGSYSWTSPEGVEYFVKYIADDDGFRIIESNAVPVGAGGLKADGTQVSFRSSEEFDTD